MGNLSRMFSCNLIPQEVLENQTRKLQLEVSSLHAENNALKERLNRAQGKSVKILSSKYRAAIKLN
jgi:hypothetical protein